MTSTGGNPRIDLLYVSFSLQGELLELDENFKRLIKELGDAINESLSDSERIAEVMSRIRNAGYDLFLVLEVTIGFNKRGELNVVHRQKINADAQLRPRIPPNHPGYPIPSRPENHRR